MRKKVNKKILEQIDTELKNVNKNSPEKNQKIITKVIEISKRNNFPLGDKRKLFCKKCKNYFFIGENCKIRIKKDNKIIKCLNCGNISRHSLNKKLKTR